MKHCITLAALFGVLAVAPETVLSQALFPETPSTLPQTQNNAGRLEGWAQVNNQQELRAFAIGVFVALSLAAAIALHPVRRAARSTTLDFIMPLLFAFYALIGMVVGFLVDQHGYIIGFVIFGIGALLRFRSNLDDPIDTVEMILVTVLGLCVGLNLPVMAILIGAVSWGLIWVAGRRLPIELRLQAETAEDLHDSIEQIRAIAVGRGWREAYLHRSHAKNAARLILLHSASTCEEDIEAALLDGMQVDGVVWKLGS